MKCPQCVARTEVTETRGAFRDRRCVNAACRLDFTTREQVMSRRDDNRLCARTRASQIETSRPPAAGVEAGRTSSPGPCAPSAAEEDATEVQEAPSRRQAAVAV